MAKKAAALAKRVLAQTHTVKMDQAKEKAAKTTVKKIETMLKSTDAQADLAKLKGQLQADHADLALSIDGQDLAKLKGQMHVAVISAKEQMAAKSPKGPEMAKKAAALAKRVLAQTRTVKMDQAKEKAAKTTVKKIETML